jgi:hypothetical protein
MRTRVKIKREWWIGVLAFLAWSAVLAIIYAQSPLFTSNQNDYFLHGLAQAGYGYLDRDWIANRADFLPAFSSLIYVTYKIFQSSTPAYAYYALVMGAYLASMYGLMDLLFDLRRSKARSLAFVAVFLAVHSAALHFILSRLTGATGTFMFEGGVADQRVLGQVFQPSVFGVFLLVSLYVFMRRRPFLALLPLAVAVYFHSVYLLAAALLTLGYMWVLFREERSLKRPLLLGVTALLIVLPVVAYTAYIYWPTSPEISRAAFEISVQQRNPQHAVISQWLDWEVLVQASIFLIGLFLIRKSRLFPVLVIVSGSTLLLTLAQVITSSDLLALLFPWRVSVILIPLGTTVLIAALVTWIAERGKAAAGRWVIGLSLLAISGLMVIGVMRFQIELGRQRSDPARPMMAWVAAHKSPTDVYLIPPKMMDFRLATGAPAYIDFLYAPERDIDVIEWGRRLSRAYSYYQGVTPCEALKILADEEGITHVVAPDNEPDNVCTTMPVIYDDGAYRIYLIKQEH